MIDGKLTGAHLYQELEVMARLAPGS